MRSTLPRSIFCSWACTPGSTRHFLGVLLYLSGYYVNCFPDNSLCYSSFHESLTAMIVEEKEEEKGAT